jgi:L-ribulose-5-phosphate 4-epimerase
VPIAIQVENAIALEAVAEMVLGGLLIDRQQHELEPYVLEKHFQRKHGPSAYYGQHESPLSRLRETGREVDC